MSVFTLERIVIGASSIKGLVNFRYGPAYQAELRAGGSELDASWRAITAGEPMLYFDTLAVDATLRLLHNTAGTAYIIPHLPIAANPAYLYMQILADGVVRGTAASNQALKVVKGLIVPQRCSGAGGLAVLTCALYADFDGVNAPVQKLAAQTLAAGGAGAAQVSRLAAVKNNTTVLYRIGDWSVDFGIRVARPQTRNIYPCDTHIVGFRPTGRWRTSDLEGAVTASGFDGAAAGAAGLLCILAKYDADGVGVEATGAIALTFRTGSRFAPTGLRGGREGLMSLDYEVQGRGNTVYTAAEDAPLFLTTGVAVPAESTTARSFMLGPVYDNAELVNAAEADFNFNLRQTVRGPADLPWDTIIITTTREPELRVTPEDQAFYQVLAEGRAIIGGGFLLFLRALDPDGLPLADAATEHFSITLPVGWIEPDEISGDHGQVIAGRVKVTPVKGSGALVTVAINVAIVAPP